ncbi:hypothetical protein [Litchfieldella rifensis]|uniref:Uncharacterized protein n=1 Tax=Litchfieldella rifensis TaxID=762643 RepID=A0ABV7LXK3_9GAMM
MMSREFLKRIGVVGVVLGLTASPLAFAEDTEKEEAIDTTTGQETKWEEEEHQGEGGKGTDDSTRVDPAPDEAGAPAVESSEGTQAGDERDPAEPGEAGAPAVEGSEGTQAGDERDPAEGNDADTQEGNAS